MTPELMPENHNWFAVYTKPRWEKKIADLLSNKGIENYCPLTKVQKHWSDRKKIIQEPLIKSYVFVCIKEEEKQEVRNTPGVLNFVYWMGKPAVIKNEDILKIRKFLNEFKNVHTENSNIRLNDKVRILNGVLMMEEGTVIEINRRTVKLMLPGLGVNLVAVIKKQSIEPV